MYVYSTKLEIVSKVIVNNCFYTIYTLSQTFQSWPKTVDKTPQNHVRNMISLS